MFTFNLAYRHNNGDVEGFAGVGFTKKTAEVDARRQLARKLEIIRPFNEPLQINSDQILTKEKCSPEEMASIRQDWLSNHRY